VKLAESVVASSA